MVKIDLITGFLGSGKTTFIKKYAQYLMSQGMNIGILENDYGAVNVDMMLLQDLEGDNCELEMVAGGCDQDCHRRRFKTKLIALGMYGFDRILVEPSGLFDVNEFFDVLYEEPLNRWYEIGNVIAIVDANLEDCLSKKSNYMLASQVANAGVVVLSKTKEASEDNKSHTLTHIDKVLKDVQCKRQISTEFIDTDWEAFEDEDWKCIMNSGYVNQSYVKQMFEDGNDFQSLYYMNVKSEADQLQMKIQHMFQDDQCGNIFRIKGFIQSQDGWIEINLTKNIIHMKPIAKGQEILIIIGENLDENYINEYMKSI